MPILPDRPSAETESRSPPTIPATTRWTSRPTARACSSCPTGTAFTASEPRNSIPPPSILQAVPLFTMRTAPAAPPVTSAVASGASPPRATKSSSPWPNGPATSGLPISPNRRTKSSSNEWVEASWPCPRIWMEFASSPQRTRGEPGRGGHVGDREELPSRDGHTDLWAFKAIRREALPRQRELFPTATAKT
jgi:hypothetical protein